MVAHPDDEVIGASALLMRVPELRLLHVTDGAPRDLRDAQAAGFAGWQDYAQARGHELAAALALAGIAADRAQAWILPTRAPRSGSPSWRRPWRRAARRCAPRS